MKHTQGEWLINGSSVKTNLFSDEEITICEVNLLPAPSRKAQRTEHHANLKIIAASPDLLAAIQRWQDEWVVNPSPQQRANNYSIEMQMNAAVIKATE